MAQRTTIEHSDLQRLIEEADRLHSAPGVAQSLLQLTKNPDFDVREVVACLERDPALSARLLRVLNSARYGLRRQVGDLRQAVLLLGPRTLRLISMTFSLVDVFSKGLAKSLYAEYWRQAITMATVAKRLAESKDVADAEYSYTAGLLADLGVLIFAQIHPETYVPLFDSAATGVELAAAERDTFGFDHAELGGCLLDAWGFPSEVGGAVRCHHGDSAQDDLGILLQAGDLLADVLWKPQTASMNAAREHLKIEFGIGTDAFIELAQFCSEEVRMEAEIFGIHLDNLPDVKKLVAQAQAQYLEISLEAALDLDSLETVMEGPTPLT